MTDISKVKDRLLEKVSDLSSSATPRQLTYMSKAIERLNLNIHTKGIQEGVGGNEIIEWHQSATPPMNVNLTRGGLGEKTTPAEFGTYGQHSWVTASFVNYNTTYQATDSNLWHYCHHHSGSRGGGIWSYWSTAQRSHCSYWGGENYCFFGSDSHASSSHCYNCGSDSCGPLGHMNSVGGAERGYGIYWTEGGNQTTGRAPRHEMRNEALIVGNYECSDKESYLVYDKQTIYLRSKRVLPGAGPGANFSQKASNNGTKNTFGTLSHNADRGELVIMNADPAKADGYNETGYMHQVKLFYNCPTINIKTDLSTLLDNNTAIQTYVRFNANRDSDLIPTWLHTAGADTDTWEGMVNRERSSQAQGGSQTGRGGNIYAPGEDVGGPESASLCVTDCKIVLTNNGDLYIATPGKYQHALHMLKRYTDPATGLTDDTYYETHWQPQFNSEAYSLNVRGYDEYRRRNIIGYEPDGLRATLVTTNYVNDVRGRNHGGGTYGNNGSSHGGAIFNIMSRHKKNVLLTSQYYYYGSGNSTYLIDKRFNKWSCIGYWQDTSHGIQWGPFGKEGFVCMYTRNRSDSNPSTRIWCWRQNPNTGFWTRADMSRIETHHPRATNYPHLVPHDA